MDEIRWKQIMIPIVITSLDGKIKKINNRFIELTGYTEEQLIGSHLEKVMDSSVRFFFNSMLYPKLMLEKEIQEIYLSIKPVDNRNRPVIFNAEVKELEAVIYCYFIPVAQREEYMKEMRSINKKLEQTVKEKIHLHNELTHLNKQLKYHAERDSLTSLYNRRLFLQKLNKLYDEILATEGYCSICIMDVDHFKHVNDTYGHPTGDQVLVGLAKEMTRFFDSSFTLARFGGEEFIILMPDYTQQEACNLADQFRKHIKGKSWEGISVTISMGISLVDSNRSVNDSVAGADSALYAAKNEGRDRVKIEDHIHFNKETLRNSNET